MYRTDRVTFQDKEYTIEEIGELPVVSAVVGPLSHRKGPSGPTPYQQSNLPVCRSEVRAEPGQLSVQSHDEVI